MRTTDATDIPLLLQFMCQCVNVLLVEVHVEMMTIVLYCMCNRIDTNCELIQRFVFKT